MITDYWISAVWNQQHIPMQSIKTLFCLTFKLSDPQIWTNVSWDKLKVGLITAITENFCCLKLSVLVKTPFGHYYLLHNETGQHALIEWGCHKQYLKNCYEIRLSVYASIWFSSTDNRIAYPLTDPILTLSVVFPSQYLSQKPELKAAWRWLTWGWYLNCFSMNEPPELLLSSGES